MVTSCGAQQPSFAGYFACVCVCFAAGYYSVVTARLVSGAALSGGLLLALEGEEGLALALIDDNLARRSGVEQHSDGRLARGVVQLALLGLLGGHLDREEIGRAHV